MRYLITGATGGLGGQILDYFIANIPLSDFAATSSNSDNRSQFESRGLNFRHLDYDNPATIKDALNDVENLLFVSTNANVLDVEKVMRQHRNVVYAATHSDVKHVWYTSLPFGGLSNHSEVAIQQAHLATERMLQESGLTFTCIREGIYVECFPLFLNWYPKTTNIILPEDGEIAFTSRVELAECTARLMIQGGFENTTILLTAGETITAKDLVSVINETTGRNVEIQYLSPEDFVRQSELHDEGGKPRVFFEILASLWKAAARGELRSTDALMGKVLGRSPTAPRDAVRKLLVEDRNHTWHQNYTSR